MLSGGRITVWGHLGQDPDVRTGKNSGKPFSLSSVAVNTGPDETSWFAITAFGRAGDNLARCQKGSGVVISGRPKIELWEGDDGNQRTTVRIMADEVVPVTNYEWNSGDEDEAGEPAAAGKNMPF